MTAPVPEDHDEPIATAESGELPAGHESDLPGPADRRTDPGLQEEQAENAGTSLDEPSDAVGSD
jgi:hypothetical protein